ncbi:MULTISPECIES: DUF2768 domain-containing protein [Bacillaceae]|jgi:hypothetical protein|uniref:DUF2768 domain-containing protein n=1 Tax=Gottfriedia luciferensis TaxID=178774 RepID=A0ABX2ZZ95_9BACI|nr:MULTISPECIES: DUF2768 domain-containing protein [Bacillaceae]ODG93669.1 hypothetical protein BED47_00410 [Gottfriedia luciferensis]PGZ91104.1 DUF2768 domain-containing protein [Bacillus sp. AFS029533]SFC24853.1 Protein of unknown function [Bacillus sp. UNCCL81]
MNSAHINEIISFVGIGLMLLSLFLIFLSRNKIKIKFLKMITAFIAYMSLIISGILITYIVLSWPS